MPNASQDKGKRAEREALAWFKKTAPDLVLWNARRTLGEGHAEDIGDLQVLPDVTVQVKAYKQASMSAGLYGAAAGATVQGLRARTTFHLGMVLVPRARAGQVRWVASVRDWPLEGVDAVAHSNSLAALRAVTAAGIDSPLVTVVNRRGVEPIHVASVTTWLNAYREALSKGTEPCPF